MNLFDYFRKKGINTVDTSFYRRIEVWKSWYDSNVRGFSSYKVYTGPSSFVRRKRKSLGMAKKLAEDMADLLFNERVNITVSDPRTHDFVKGVLKQNAFFVLANDYQERKAYTGTVAYIPHIRRMEIDSAGYPLTGEIGIDYVSAHNIFPVSWSNGRVTECIFAFPRTFQLKKYVQLQRHRPIGGQYVIENTILESMSGSLEWIELHQDQWKSIPPFSNLAERMETGSDRPQYVIDRLNIVNNADLDESNPMGVAIFANSIDVLKDLDIVFDSYSNEFELGRKRIFVAPEMTIQKNGAPAFDPEDTVFYTLPEDYSDKDDKGLIHEVDLALRTEEHSKAINDGLNYLALKCGFGSGRYKFEVNKGQVKTATEVISENSDLYRMVKKHELILEDVLRELVKIIIRLGKVLNYPLDETADICIQFDDSIIEDKNTERERDRADVAMGAMQLWEYRMKWYHENEAAAKAMVSIQEEVIVD